MKTILWIASLFLLTSGISAAQDIDFTGTWVGSGYSMNPKHILRTPRQTIEITRSGDELTGALVGRRSRTTLKVVVEECTGNVTLVGYLEFEGGEHLRWYLVMTDGKLDGTVWALHDGPKKWDEDWTGPIRFERKAE
jgi:hypothetical protein